VRETESVRNIEILMRIIDSEGVGRSLEKLPPRGDSRSIELYTHILLERMVNPDHGVYDVIRIEAFEESFPTCDK
jgi:hypothetical protein